MNLYDKLLIKSDRYLKLCLGLFGDIIAYHIGPQLSIEEWKIWDDELGRKNKSVVVNHFEKVEIIKK